MTRNERLALLAALGLIALFLAPVLGTAFLGDDTYNNYLDGWRGWEHLSFARGLALLFAATNLNNGRFYPVFPLLLAGEFHLVHAALLMKSLVVAAVLLNAFTFWLALRRIVPALATPALAVLPATLQIRFYQDPIVAFSLHMQLALEFVLLGFLGLATFGTGGRRTALALGASCYALACLTYEATYAYALAFAALARQSVAGVRTRNFATLLFFVIPLACAVVALTIRAHVALAPDSAYRAHWDARAIAATFVREVAGGVPLSYAAFDPGGFLRPLATLASAAGWAGLALGAFAALLAFAVLGRATPPRELRFAALFGFLLATSPALLVVLSGRQQREVVWGLAYTPVYLQYFGVALLLAAGANAIVRGRRSAGAALALVAGFTVAATYGSNRLTLAQFATYWGTTVLPSALDAGLLGDAPEGARLYVDDSYPVNRQLDAANWSAKYFYYFHSGKRFEVRPLAQIGEAGAPSYALLGAFEGGARGEAAAGAVAGVARSAGSAPIPLVENATVYASGPNGKALRAFRSQCGAVTLESVLHGAASGVSLTYGAGFFPEERAPGARWRWSGRSTELSLANPTERPRTVDLSFALRPARDEPAPVHIGWPAGAKAFVLHGEDAAVAQTLTLAPHVRLAIPLEVGGAAYRPAHDSRLLLFQLRDLVLSEPACGGLERDAAASNRRSNP